TASDLAVYRDQLKEVEADRARGLLSDVEAEAARVEISRRLLARAEADGVSAAGGARGQGLNARTAFVSAVLLIPALSMALYLAYGSPGLPGQPHAERVAAPADKA